MADTTQDGEVDVTGLNTLSPEEYQEPMPIPPPQLPQPTPQDFSSLLFMMQQQIQGQNMLYQTQMESLQRQHKEQLDQQKLQMETILSQNKAIDELKRELGIAKSANAKEQCTKPARPVIHAGQTDN